MQRDGKDGDVEREEPSREVELRAVVAGTDVCVDRAHERTGPGRSRRPHRVGEKPDRLQGLVRQLSSASRSGT